MRSFSEFVSERDGVIGDPTADRLSSDNLFHQILHKHGDRFRSLLKDIIRSDMLDDDVDLRADLKSLVKSIVPGSHEFPPTKRPEGEEPDIVSRPASDGGSPVGVGQ